MIVFIVEEDSTNAFVDAFMTKEEAEKCAEHKGDAHVFEYEVQGPFVVDPERYY